MKKQLILVTGAALAAIALPAHAEFKISATRSNNFQSLAASVPLPLNDAGATIRTFNLPSAKPMVLHYSAVCTVSGADFNWIDIDIVVNGVVVAPTVGLQPFCSGGSGFVRAAISVRIQGIAGQNSVRIIGNRTNALAMSFAHSSLLVFDP
jgi:hypothetical protein